MKRFQKMYCVLSVLFGIVVLSIVLSLSYSSVASATTTDDPAQALEDDDSAYNNQKGSNYTGFTVELNNDNGELSGTVKMLVILTVISLAPSLLIMLTSFTRIVIVLHFVRQAIGTQTSPPNQILVGLALFLTIFIMQPVFTQINEDAIQPLDAGEITQEEALERGMEPLREFMFGETQAKDINLFLEITGNEEAASLEDIPTSTLIPAFILSELRTAFIIGFLIYIPFIIIDMVVASVLMSMGMMMLPPTTISMPFKILLFVLADGWDLVIGNLVKTFY